MKEIALTHGYHTKVDDNDFDYLNQFNWSLSVNSSNKRCVYPRTYIAGKTFFMHQLLIPKKNGFIIDHADKDGLNNQRENLRYVSFSQNAVNSRIGKNNSSGYTGVTKQGNLWRSRIWKDWKCIELGNFSSFEEAKKARIEAEEKYFPGLIKDRVTKVKFITLKRTPVPEIKRYSNATAKYKGVYPQIYKNSIRWRAQIRTKGKNIYLGEFKTEQEAAKIFIERFRSIYGVVPYEI